MLLCGLVVVVVVFLCRQASYHHPTPLTVDTHTAELEARLKAAEEALGVERKRAQELELALKRKRDSEMDVDQGDDEDEDWDGRPAAKKGKASGAAASSTVCQSSLCVV